MKCKGFRVTKKVYFNHDGGVDDLVSLFLLLQMENVQLIGVSTIGADCYLEPSLSASVKLLIVFQRKIFKVAPSYERGKIHFLKNGVCMPFYGRIANFKWSQSNTLLQM